MSRFRPITALEHPLDEGALCARLQEVENGEAPVRVVRATVLGEEQGTDYYVLVVFFEDKERGWRVAAPQRYAKAFIHELLGH